MDVWVPLGVPSLAKVATKEGGGSAKKQTFSRPQKAEIVSRRSARIINNGLLFCLPFST